MIKGGFQAAAIAAAVVPLPPKFNAFSQFSRCRSLVTWIWRKSSAEAAELLPLCWRPEAPSLLALKEAVEGPVSGRPVRERPEADLGWEASGEAGLLLTANMEEEEASDTVLPLMLLAAATAAVDSGEEGPLEWPTDSEKVTEAP